MPAHLFEAAAYEAVFDEADEDHDDFISLKDLAKICRKYKYFGPATQLQRVFDRADENKDKKLSYEEYMIAMGLQPRIRPKKQQAEEANPMQIRILKEIFEAFDQDKNGVIDREELAQVFAELGKTYSEKQVQRMIDLVDKDGTGTLDYEEFLQAVLSKHVAE
ncbi:hypothetical protein CAPTEDRAFT_148693 [Capitella teleta]|uniref:EF-hand domain-containing protein n=1 Tax=Capitella teleta TaxID=283909 RepID=R7U906_CAPTE|nr:hypothetical protein CAPTEDRAFT_148693 [Capitella teleta]|eukprot:ELT99615.1 hypothetical protein CAPTEDRAFT_148693 [Capitella teleta]